MLFVRFAIVFTIFLIGYTSLFSHAETNSTSPSQIAYYYADILNDTTLICLNPDFSDMMDYYFNNKTVLKLLDGSVHTAERSKIETHNYYKIMATNGFIDTLEQVFLYPGWFIYSELSFGILNITDTITKTSLKSINNSKYLVPMWHYQSLTEIFYPEYTTDWFFNNIGTYLCFGYNSYLNEDKSVIGYRKLTNSLINNFTGKLLKLNGKEFTVFGNPVYVSPSTKFYDERGNTILLDDISENDRLDIDYFFYSYDKYIALRITKLPHREEMNRYSEDVIKVSNDTIYTTSHFLKLSSVQSKKDVNGDDIETDSLFAHYRAVTFEVPSNEDRNEIRNVEFLHATFNQKDSLHYRGTAIGRINSIQFPNITLGSNKYLVGNGAIIRNKFGDSTLASELTIPNNALVKLFYSRVDNGSNIDFVVNFIALEDTSTFTSVTEPKANSFSVFPNPITTNQTSIEYFSEVDEMIQMNVVSVDGKTLFSQNFLVKQGNNSIVMSMNSITNGQYFLEIVSTNTKNRHSTPIQIMR